MTIAIKLVPAAAVAALLLGGCAYHSRDGYRGHGRASVAVGTGGYYTGYYDGAYGAFNDGYWGNDGAFYYSDRNHNWHRDDGHHFRRDNGGNGWKAFHGSGRHRDH